MSSFNIFNRVYSISRYVSWIIVFIIRSVLLFPSCSFSSTPIINYSFTACSISSTFFLTLFTFSYVFSYAIVFLLSVLLPFFIDPCSLFILLYSLLIILLFSLHFQSNFFLNFLALHS